MFQNNTNESLLLLLKVERVSFKNSELMQQIVNELVLRGVYPAKPLAANGIYSPYQMMATYGADWHEYKGLLNCPSCNADWRDLKNGPPFKRSIIVYDHYADKTVATNCPDCGKYFPRSE